MASLNKATLIGHLGRDPEVRYTTNGSAICNLSIATTEKWADKASGEKREATEWHRVILTDRAAEAAGEYLKKGSAVYIEGKIKTRKWTDKNGVEKYTTEIWASSMQFLDRRQQDGQPGGAPSQDQPRQPPAAKPQPQRQSTGFDDMDDDIPF